MIGGLKLLTRLRKKLTYPHVVATLALFLALGGGAAWAIKQGSIGSRELEDAGVRSIDIKDDGVKGKDILESSLGQVPDAAALQGQGPDAFVPASSDRRFFARLSFGQSADVLQAGTLKLTAQCLQNITDDSGNPNRDVARLVISTSQNGAVFDGKDQKDGTDASDFLNTDTPEADRVIREDDVPTGTSEVRGRNEAIAVDPNGTALVIGSDQLVFLHRLLGSDCIFIGTGRVVSG